MAALPRQLPAPHSPLENGVTAAAAVSLLPKQLLPDRICHVFEWQIAGQAGRSSVAVIAAAAAEGGTVWQHQPIWVACEQAGAAKDACVHLHLFD